MTKEAKLAMIAKQELEDNNKLGKCFWCEEEFEPSELRVTHLGLMCGHCIEAIRSRGEKVRVYG